MKVINSFFISIADDGKGFSEKELLKADQPYYSGEQQKQDILNKIEDSEDVCVKKSIFNFNKKFIILILCISDIKLCLKNQFISTLNS